MTHYPKSARRLSAWKEKTAQIRRWLQRAARDGGTAASGRAIRPYHIDPLAYRAAKALGVEFGKPDEPFVFDPTRVPWATLIERPTAGQAKAVAAILAYLAARPVPPTG